MEAEVPAVAGQMRPTFCIDIGAPCDSRGRNNFGWASNLGGRESSDDIQELVESLDAQLAVGAVSLGVEAPIVVPLRDRPEHLTKARAGDGNRAWSAGAGAAATAINLPILHFILGRLENARRVVFREGEARGPGDLLVWEAFVSGGAKGEHHEEDARRALAAYLANEGGPQPDQGPMLNTVASVTLRAGLAADLSAPVKIVRVGA
jgi:hypothetical protein